jgi:hypothetical protein
VTSSEQGLTDKGNALLTRAENLCKEVRKCRKESQKHKAKTDSKLRKMESKVLEQKIQGYSDLCQSQMKGYVSTNMLSDLDKSMSELTTAKSTVDLSKDLTSKTKETNVDVEKECGDKEEPTNDLNDRTQGVSEESNNNEKNPVNKVGIQASESVSPSVRKDHAKTAKPAVDTAKVNFVKQNVAPLNKNNLMKIINAPRSHKERMQLANLMKGSKPKPVRPKLNLQPQEPALPADLADTVSNDVVVGESESEFIAFECLPDNLRLKVEKLLNDGPDTCSEGDMCFSDIEGVEYPFVTLESSVVDAPLVELPDVNLNGKRRRSATTTSSNAVSSFQLFDLFLMFVEIRRRPSF